MALPTGPLMLAPGAIDTPSTNGFCIYPGQPIPAFWVSPNVLINKTPVSMIINGQYDLVSGGTPTPTDPVTYALRLPVCAVPVGRVTIGDRNNTVSINKFKPAVLGDTTRLVVGGKERAILGPTQFPNVFITSRRKF